ncbi:Glycosyl_hydrolase family 25 protein [Hexamita inflata]|uniref:Glycosyl hydrolase family 25 protein n=1 Tax=Hexamita inflata TaxID=28002 RepID=A0AA86TLQ6_9EUKA|nr:Glycosyl hydrolase family 25 protein [Hexamita inflata]
MLSVILTLTTRGFDVSYYQGAVSQDTFNCLYNNGYRFAIIQAQIGSTFNNNAISDYWRAKQAGIEYVDFYIFPTTAKDARGQVRDTINRLISEGVMAGMVWLDVESIELFFDDWSTNQWYISTMLDEMSNILGANRVGVYSNWNQWQSIVGWNWTGASGHQLWYPHYDNWQSFDDFQNLVAGTLHPSSNTKVTKTSAGPPSTETFTE